MLAPLSAFLQKKILFRPTRLAADHAYRFGAPFQELWFEAADGVRFNALFFPAFPSLNLQTLKSADRVVLYFHGNRDNLQRWGALHTDFTALGYDFLVSDYRGYGKSSGEPEEAALFSDAELQYRWLRETLGYAPDQIVLYGRSLGSAMAAYLAAHCPARMLILETPFDSFPGLLASHLRREEAPFQPALLFPNDQHVRMAKMPVLIFHGTNDRVVPYARALRLRDCLKPGDAFVTIEGGSHNNLREFPVYRERLKTWLA